MIWYILDEKATPDVFRQGKFTYAILNVVRVHSVEINDEDNEPNIDEIMAKYEKHDSSRLTLTTTSDRMINMFF